MQLTYDSDRPTQVNENGFYSWDDDERTSTVMIGHLPNKPQSKLQGGRWNSK